MHANIYPNGNSSSKITTLNDVSFSFDFSDGQEVCKLSGKTDKPDKITHGFFNVIFFAGKIQITGVANVRCENVEKSLTGGQSIVNMTTITANFADMTLSGIDKKVKEVPTDLLTRTLNEFGISSQLSYNSMNKFTFNESFSLRENLADYFRAHDQMLMSGMYANAQVSFVLQNIGSSSPTEIPKRKTINSIENHDWTLPVSRYICTYTEQIEQTTSINFKKYKDIKDTKKITTSTNADTGMRQMIANFGILGTTEITTAENKQEAFDKVENWKSRQKMGNSYELDIFPFAIGNLARRIAFFCNGDTIVRRIKTFETNGNLLKIHTYRN